MSDPESNERISWWQEARVGMFIHWGVYAVPGRGEWVMCQEHIPRDEYALLAQAFNPQHYRPNEWVAIARDAGMRYIVLTARHHDGFCMFDSRASDFTSVKTATRRDLVAEYAEACRSAGMRMGLYYSLVDWRFPAAMPGQKRLPDDEYLPMVEQAHAQVRELCTNYGKLDILWYDGMHPAGPDLWRSSQLNAMARSLQPGIVINDRSGLPEDFATPENTISPREGPWEACHTMNETWGYNRPDRSYKTPCQILYLLLSCVSQGGNLLLNVSPDADGRIPIEQLDILRSVGEWMRVHHKAIHGGGVATFQAPGLGWTVRAGGTDYLIPIRWHGGTLTFGWCQKRVRSARLLSTGQEVRVEQKEDRVWLHGLPVHPPDPYANPIGLQWE